MCQQAFHYFAGDYFAVARQFVFLQESGYGFAGAAAVIAVGPVAVPVEQGAEAKAVKQNLQGADLTFFGRVFL